MSQLIADTYQVFTAFQTLSALNGWIYLTQRLCQFLYSKSQVMRMTIMTNFHTYHFYEWEVLTVHPKYAHRCRVKNHSISRRLVWTLMDFVFSTLVWNLNRSIISYCLWQLWTVAVSETLSARLWRDAPGGPGVWGGPVVETGGNEGRCHRLGLAVVVYFKKSLE